MCTAGGRLERTESPDVTSRNYDLVPSRINLTTLENRRFSLSDILLIYELLHNRIDRSELLSLAKLYAPVASIRRRSLLSHTYMSRPLLAV